jgi:hypothetical protein
MEQSINEKVEILCVSLGQVVLVGEWVSDRESIRGTVDGDNRRVEN